MRRRGERGETLAEVLVSTTLLGIIGLGIIGAIASVLISTQIDRSVSAGETVLRSYVAAIEQAPYVDCAGAGAYKPGGVGYTSKPNNFDATVTKVSYQDPVARDARPVMAPNVQLTFPNSACPNGTDPGLQMIDAQVQSTGARRATEHVTFVKRRLTTTSTT